VRSIEDVDIISMFLMRAFETVILIPDSYVMTRCPPPALSPYARCLCSVCSRSLSYAIDGAREYYYAIRLSCAIMPPSSSSPRGARRQRVSCYGTCAHYGYMSEKRYRRVPYVNIVQNMLLRAAAVEYHMASTLITNACFRYWFHFSA